MYDILADAKLIDSLANNLDIKIIHCLFLGWFVYIQA